jgi:hypothetical protein
MSKAGGSRGKRGRITMPNVKDVSPASDVQNGGEYKGTVERVSATALCLFSPGLSPANARILRRASESRGSPGRSRPVPS